MDLLGPSDFAGGIVKQFHLSVEILQCLPRVLRRGLHSHPKINPTYIFRIEDKRLTTMIFQGSLNYVKLETMKNL